MIHNRHPDVAGQLIAQLEGRPETPNMRAASDAAHQLNGVRDFVPPSWRALADGARPLIRDIDNFERGNSDGWQHVVASKSDEVFASMPDSVVAAVRSQGGSGAGLALSCSPTCRTTRLEAQLFRVTLLRRLQLPLPFTERSCRCGLPLDSLGHHRAACARAGVLGKRGWALESIAARICREGGGRVTTNVLVRDLDLALPGAVADGRRLEVVVDGLPLFGGAQLAVDTTLVCALRSDGRPTTRAAVEDGAKVTRARRRKETTYPELVGRHARARLVVLGVEVGGRFSTETQSFLSQLARAKARCENSILRNRVEQAWRLRWGSLLACTTAHAVSSSLLGLPSARGADGDTPASHDVERDYGMR